MENRIDFVIPAEIVASASAGVNGVVTLLKPYIIGLSKEERKKLPKMGDGTSPFVQKALEYCQSNPEFIPAYFKPEQFNNAFTGWAQLNSIFRPVQQLYSDLEDTIMQAGSESYGLALIYYNSVKQAAKEGIQGAKPIYEDLKKRFAHNGPSQSDNENDKED
ncbi:MAG: hypothetical protein ACK5JD_09110 [Mangrovibacterium sp.]